MSRQEKQIITLLLIGVAVIDHAFIDAAMLIIAAIVFYTSKPIVEVYETETQLQDSEAFMRGVKTLAAALNIEIKEVEEGRYWLSQGYIPFAEVNEKKERILFPKGAKTDENRSKRQESGVRLERQRL